jgi:sensor histidine kinase YesM
MQVTAEVSSLNISSLGKNENRIPRSTLRPKWFIHGAVLFLIITLPFLTMPIPFEKKVVFLDSNHLGANYQNVIFATNIFIFRLIFVGTYTTLTYIVNILFFVPKFLIKRKLKYFIGCITLTILGFIMGNVILNYYFTGTFFLTFPPSHLIFANFPKYISPLMVLPIIAVFSVSTGIEMTSEWLKQDKKQQDIINEKLEAELALLKFQINPHFLFNTLNNIYALAETKSDRTQSAILLLSDLLRYAIYESNVYKIHLSREIEQIKNYIELQNLRISSKKSIQIIFEIEGAIENQQIAPMLLLPFIENAFKHGISYISNAQITIKLEIKHNQLIFRVLNHKIKNTDQQKDDYKGLGLKNVKRRLDLIYPENYSLAIQDHDDLYETTLEIRNL